jgi:hypothetical protein
MSEQWVDLPLDKPYFANLNEDAIVSYQTAIENGFVNELGGHSRFPGLVERVNLADNGRVYLNDFAGDLIASTSKGQVYRIDERYNATNVTGVPVGGGRRTIFAKTDRDLMMAAGGPIIRLRNLKTELLSQAAPLSTHVGWIDGYTLAVELNTQILHYSANGAPDQWDPLNVETAESTSSNINSLLITPYREIMLGTATSIEQFERLPTGTSPFFRRWAVGDGVQFPYVEVFADNALWTINKLTELVRFAGQISTSASGEVGRLLEGVDDWSDAWIGGFPDNPLHIVGQKFILLQAPNATNSYGTKGLTLLYDYRNKRFSTLWGWDENNGVPNRWPGWSHHPMWNKVFVGGEGKVYEIDPNVFSLGGQTQRWLVRTAHTAEGNAARLKNFRLRVVRGIGSSSVAPKIRVRCSRDARPFGAWIERSLGLAGQRLQFIEFGSFGVASTFQFEISCADDAPVDLIKAQVKVDPIGH